MIKIGDHNYYPEDDKLEIVNNEPFYFIHIKEDGTEERIECWSEEDFIRAIQKRKWGGPTDEGS